MKKIEELTEEQSEEICLEHIDKRTCSLCPLLETDKCYLMIALKFYRERYGKIDE